MAVHFPGTEGGPDWDGETYDPKTGFIILPVNNLGIVVQMTKATSGPMAYTDSMQYFRNPDTRDLCVKPPWASLVAVNGATGDIAWSVPLGVTDHLPEAVRNTGRPGHGGAITTDGGLTFIGFSDDQRFHAFDTRTGKELWTWRLEANAIDAPVTYRGGDGRQYVAVTSTGGSYVGTPVTSDTLTAFVLPK
jgi:quinoprotein glucose dehydrogenase